jgi:integrase
MEEGWNQRDSNVSLECPIAALSNRVEISTEAFFHIVENPRPVTKQIPARQAPSIHSRSFHHWPAAYAERSIDKGVKKGTLTADDAALIRSFVAEIKATKGICQGRANKLVFNIVAWRKFIGPFRENTIGDLYVGIDRLNQARIKGKPYKTNTKRDQMLVLKRFYRWLIENQYSTVPEKKITAIHAPGTDRMTKVAADLLDETEIRAMIDACQNSRDRAIVATIYDGGFRVETIGRLTWGQLKFDDYGAIVNINEKTGQARYVRLVGATQYLNQWRNDYPFPVTP